MIKQALAAALTVGALATSVTAVAAKADTVACGEEKKTQNPKPQPKPPSADGALACGEEKKTQNPKPQPKPPSIAAVVWSIG